MFGRSCAIVDVELLVQGGAPRQAFTLETMDPHPTWSLDLELLRELGWEIGPGSVSPPPGRVDPTIPHPHALGPMWAGGGVWRSTFRRAGEQLKCTVAHELLESANGETCDPGPPLASGSPWHWRIEGLGDRPRCGRAENPRLSALQVEELLLRSGVEPFEPTPARRRLSY